VRNDIAALPFSSGTTGRSKGVMLTHHSLAANICQVAPFGMIDEDERVLATLPFFHIYGMVLILGLGLYRGATLYTLPRFELEVFLRAIQDHKITYAPCVPPIVQLAGEAALKHDDATRKNIPTAEYQSVIDEAQKHPLRVA